MVGFSWAAPVRVAALTRAFLLGDGEPAPCGLLRVLLVEVAINLLERGCVESLTQDGSPTDDVLTSLHLFGVAVQHLSLDFVSQGFGVGLGFFDQSFNVLQSVDFGSDLDGRHSVFSFDVRFCSPML